MWMLRYSWSTSSGTPVVDQVPLAAKGFSARGRREASAEALQKLRAAPGLKRAALSLFYRVAYQGSEADFIQSLEELS